METSKNTAVRKGGRSVVRRAGGLEALEQRVLLSAAVVDRFDVSTADAVYAANLDGQTGAEIVAIKGNVATVFNMRTNLITTYTFPSDETIHITNEQQLITNPADPTQPFDLRTTGTDITSTTETVLQQMSNAVSAEIYGTNGHTFSWLNIATGNLLNFNVGTAVASDVQVENLDGQPGYEYVFTGTGANKNDIIVVNPHANTLQTFTITDGFTQIGFAALGGQGGKSIVAVNGNKVVTIDVNARLTTLYTLPTGIQLQLESILPPDTLQQAVMNAPQDVTPDQEMIIFRSGQYSIGTRLGFQTVSLTTGNTPLFLGINVDGKAGADMVAANGSTVYILSQTSNTVHSFTFNAAEEVEVSFAPMIDSDLSLSGTKGLVFATTPVEVTVLNPVTLANRSFFVQGGIATFYTDDFGGNAGSQIVAQQSNGLSILNPNAYTFKVYKTGNILGVSLEDYDGVAGDEIAVEINNAITIITPRTQTIRTYNVGAYAAVRVDDFNGQPGNEIAFIPAASNAITVLSPRSGTFKKYNVGAFTAIGEGNVDGQPGDELVLERTGSVTILNSRLQTFKVYATNPGSLVGSAIGPVGGLPGNPLILVFSNAVMVINGAGGMFRSIAFPAVDRAFLDNLGAPGFTDLITETGKNLTVTNLVNGATAPLTLQVAVPQLLFDDLDGQAGDEIFFFDGTVLTVVKAG